MKKVGKSSKKGFTLVELIVVLVILAVLAAMLVPALVGYVDKAKAEKEYQTAATVYGAAQATITEMYGRDALSKKSGSINKNTKYTIGSGSTAKSVKYGEQVLSLAGVDTNAVSSFQFTYKDYIISGGSVKINNHTYTLTIKDGVPSWTAE